MEAEKNELQRNQGGTEQERARAQRAIYEAALWQAGRRGLARRIWFADAGFRKGMCVWFPVVMK